MKKPKIKKVDWYGFNHKKAVKKLGADRFCNEFTVRKNDGSPRAVYYSSNPNRSEGHKSYPMLHVDSFTDTLYVSAMDQEEIDECRWYPAIHCLHCNWIIFSIHRHHFNPCKCRSKKKRVYIDGGREYYAPRIVFGDNANFKNCEIDMLTDEIRYSEAENELLGVHGETLVALRKDKNAKRTKCTSR